MRCHVGENFKILTSSMLNAFVKIFFWGSSLIFNYFQLPEKLVYWKNWGCSLKIFHYTAGSGIKKKLWNFQMLVLYSCNLWCNIFPQKSRLRGWGLCSVLFPFRFLNSISSSGMDTGMYECTRYWIEFYITSIERMRRKYGGSIVGYRVKNYRKIIIVGSLELCFMQLIFYD